MASFNRVVSFNIIIQDASPSRPNFGTIAALAYHSLGPYRRVYETTPTGRAAMVVDGFANTHDAYRKNAAIGKQAPKVPSFKLFNRAAPNEQTYTLTPNAAGLRDGTRYLFSLNGTEADYTLEIPDTIGWDDADTIDLICEELTTQLTGITNVTVTDNDTSITLELTDPEGPRMYLKGVPSWLTVKDTSTDAGIATDLDNALLEDPAFYGICMDGMNEAEINAAAAWCEANGKIGHFQSIDSDILTNSTTDVASDLKAALYTYSGVFYSRDAGGQLAAAIMGQQFAENPGASTWENKILAGIVADALTPTEITNALGKNASLYLPFGDEGDVAITHGAKASSGRFFDLTRDRDWLQTNAQLDLFTHLIRRKKVPFTQPGIDELLAVSNARFELAEQAGILDAGWAVTFPLIGTIDPADKASRRLVAPNATSGNFQGAIHGVDVSGVLAI